MNTIMIFKFKNAMKVSHIKKILISGLTHFATGFVYHYLIFVNFYDTIGMLVPLI